MVTNVKKPTLRFKFYNLTSEEEKAIQTIVQKNIEVKAASYLKSIYATNKDAEVQIDYKIQKNKQNRFEASFRFIYNGKTFVYKNKVAFKFTEDLINHAFLHFNRQIGEKNKVKTLKWETKSVKKEIIEKATTEPTK